jgi:hypothetical protein
MPRGLPLCAIPALHGARLLDNSASVLEQRSGLITACPKTALPKALQLPDSTRLNSSILPVHKQMISDFTCLTIDEAHFPRMKTVECT